MESGRYVIGVDLGGTKIEAALVESSGVILGRLRQPTDVGGGAQAIMSQIAEMVRELEGTAPGTIEGIGIGIPGQIDVAGEQVIFAPNLKWVNVSAREHLSRLLHHRFHLDNDVRVATRGEWCYGGGREVDTFVCLFLGTGVGGGIVLNGNLLKGASNTAGELGHMVVKFDGPLCTCHNRGCLEAYAGGWAIARNARVLLADRRHEGKILLDLVKGNIDAITGEVVSKAYQQGDVIAQEVVQAASAALVAWAVSIANGLNPHRLILGGGLLRGFPHFVDDIREGVKKYALKAAVAELQVMSTQLEGNANLLGAAALALQP